MVVYITPEMSDEEVKAQLSKIKSGKAFDSTKYLGKVKWNEDPMEFQKRMRSEWDIYFFVIPS